MYRHSPFCVRELVATTLLLMPSTVFAAYYQEGITAPVFDNPNWYDHLPMDIGGNVVAGALSGVCEAGGTDCNPVGPFNGQDNIFFEIGDGSSLSEISISYDYLNGPSEFFLSLVLNDDEGNTLLWEPLIGIGNTFSTQLQTGPGRYYAGIYGQRAGGEGEYALNYSLGLFLEQNGVAGVPEPATWAMLIAGFGIVGAAKRRRREIALA